jgi:1,4-alpha-glucan branching enzyme
MVIRQAGSIHLFRVYRPEARSVELVGSFTQWGSRAVAMVREDTGWWSATITLAPGDHDFSYLVDGSQWVTDFAASGVKRNGFGGWISQLHVAAEVQTRTRQTALAA